MNNESAIQQKLAAIFSANKDDVTVPKIYIDMTDDYRAGAVLDELMFWTLPKKGTGKTSLRVFRDGVLWLAVRRSDWWERKRLSERQADRAIDKLIELELIEKDVFLFDGKPTVHIRVNMPVFVKLYGDKINEMAALEDDENLVRDISDLYEMMGFSPSPNGYPNQMVNSNSPNGEMLNLPNGKIINSPVQPETTSLSSKDFEQANAKVDAMIRNSASPDWQGRETFLPDHYPLVDWYHTTTGQVCSKSKQKDWHRAVNDWTANNLTPSDMQAAYDMDIKWRGVFTSPNQLTDKAIALKSKPQAQKQDEEFYL